MEYKLLVITKEGKYQSESLSWTEQSATTYYAKSLQDALFHLSIFSYHLIILEKGDDEEITCKMIEAIRSLKKTPIVVLMSGLIEEKRAYIDSGADAIFGYSIDDEIKLHIYALIRRYLCWHETVATEKEIITELPLTVNRISHKVFWWQKEIKLTRHEFDFLYLLSSTPGRVYTFSQIYQIIWKEHYYEDCNNIIWCLSHRIRNKLKAIDPRASESVKNVRGIGYYFELDKE